MPKSRRRRKNEAEYELQDIEVKKVDLVGSPATGDTFLVIRSDDDEDEMLTDTVPASSQENSDNMPEASVDIKEKTKRSDVVTESETYLSESKGLMPEFQQQTVDTLNEILRQHMELIKAVQEMPVDDEGATVLPESILDNF